MLSSSKKKGGGYARKLKGESYLGKKLTEQSCLRHSYSHKGRHGHWVHYGLSIKTEKGKELGNPLGEKANVKEAPVLPDSLEAS